MLAKQLDRQLPIPHRAVDRAVDRLILRGEQPFDLVVGPVDRPGAPGFLLALAAELERRFGKRSLRPAVADELRAGAALTGSTSADVFIR